MGRAFSLGFYLLGFLERKSCVTNKSLKEIWEKFWTFIWEPLDATQADLSKRIFGVSQTVDSFFGDDQLKMK